MTKIKYHNSYKKSSHIIIILCAIFLICSHTIIFAGSQDGTGGGGGPTVLTYLVESTPENNATGVYTNSTITLHFSHNVADVAIRENNTASISMCSISGTPVQIAVSYPDEFALRQYIYITPSGLEPNTTYVITIAPTFISRNGYHLGTNNTVDPGTSESLTFTTGDGALQETATENVSNTQSTNAQTANTQITNTQSSVSTSNSSKNSTTSTEVQVETESKESQVVETTESSDLTETEKTTQADKNSNLKPGKVSEEDLVELNVNNNHMIIIIVIVVAGLICIGVIIILKNNKLKNIIIMQLKKLWKKNK